MSKHHRNKDLLSHVPFLHGHEDSKAPPLKQVAGRVQNEYGLNVEPGDHDDGWPDLPPVELSDGTVLRLFKDGEAAHAAIAAIRHAKWRILLEIYIWSDDETGRAFADALAEKARAGVEVFVIYDAFGSLLASNDVIDAIRDAGAHVLKFHPISPSDAQHRWRPINRDHRKVLVVDDDIAGVGGLNIGNRYAGTWVAENARVDESKMWRDAGVGIRGQAAMIFARAFQATWTYCLNRGRIRRALHVEGLNLDLPAKGKRVGRSREVIHPVGPLDDLITDTSPVACIGSAPTLSSPLRPFLHQLIDGASKEILLTMAYFAPDDSLIDALCRAAQRGVRVRLVLPGRSDVKLLIIAARSFYARLMDAGCEVFERQHAMLHQKSIVVDRRVGVIGSTNLDYRSIEFNLELSAVIESGEFADQLAAMFEHDVAFSKAIDPNEWRDRPWRDRLVQWAVSRARYLL